MDIFTRVGVACDQEIVAQEPTAQKTYRTQTFILWRNSKQGNMHVRRKWGISKK